MLKIKKKKSTVGDYFLLLIMLIVGIVGIMNKNYIIGIGFLILIPAKSVLIYVSQHSDKSDEGKS